MTDSGKPMPGELMTGEYVASLARQAYLWGWALENVHNRNVLFEQVPEPGLAGGVMPVAPPGRLAMLHDYVSPDERQVACPNQDVVYGMGLVTVGSGPAVLQVPDFGDRFWVYQIVDQRTESYAPLGKMYGTAPGLYLLAPASWDGEVPEGIAGVFRFDTAVSAVIPRAFMDDTDADRAAIQPVINQIMMYPLAEYTGQLQTTDWSQAPILPPLGGDSGDNETHWVDPTTFFDDLPTLLTEVPARPGEQALYDWIGSLTDPTVVKAHADLLRDTAVAAEKDLIGPLFQFRHIGVPAGNHWTTQHDGAQFGTDYLSRTAMAKANIFVNSPNETAYFYLDLDEAGERLDGDRAYTVTFASGQLPPARGFWSVTLYNQHHFFAPNELNRYSLGTKNKDLKPNPDGSLTLTVQASRPDGPDANWLPAPAGEVFSLYLRAYWPEDAVLDGRWTPPPAVPADPA
ncbi:DUF1214 domain-containing protein [Kitasatospora sp. NPDC094011]|uniref:DUF1214 domain-containing protein n=1 Tax=Kitasatospora sp. NPDC094011 TaxID=3364090 RepID=UPI00381F3AD9